MSRGTVLAGLLIACCVVTVVLLLRGRGSAGEDENAPASGSIPATPEGSTSGSTPISRDRPQLAAPAPAVTHPAVPFGDEPVDRAFSADHTGLVRATVNSAIADARASEVRLAAVECRSQRCQLTLEGPGLQDVLARLEDERGFYGKASELALHDLVSGDDGQPLRVSMTLTFGPKLTADR